jgi:hypothetical protein
MENFHNKTEVIIDLQQRGYDQDFVLNNEHLLYVQSSELIAPDDFEITETYRFDGKSRSRDNYVVYAVRSIHNDIKGILMTSYSAFSHGLSIHLWSKLAVDLK